MKPKTPKPRRRKRTAAEPQLLVRYHFDDGPSEAVPFEKVLEQHLEQLRKLGEATGNRGPYLAFLRRVGGAWLEAERALARRKRGGKARGANVRRVARTRAPDSIEAHVLATAARLDRKRENPRGLPRRIIEASGWHYTDSMRRMVARILENRTRS